MSTTLPIPLQSVTMSAEQYEKICTDLEKAMAYNENTAKFIEEIQKNGVSIETQDPQAFYNGFKEVMVANDHSTGNIRIAIR